MDSRRGEHVRNGIEPVFGDEPRRAHHPQRVVAERHLGGHRRAQHAGGEIRRAAVRIDEPRLGQRAAPWRSP